MSKGRKRIGLAQRFDFPAKAWFGYALSRRFAAEIAIRYGASEAQLSIILAS
jgi:hypothetical protein